MFGRYLLTFLISISYGTCVVDAGPDDVTNTLNKFALEFHRKLAANADWDQNIAMSAMSVFTAFSALSLGTGGNTKSEMQKALNVDTKSETSLGDWYKKHMRSQDDFVLANKLFIADDFDLLSTYVKNVKDIFDMAIESFNASNPDTAEKKMNSWIDETTGGLIREMFPSGHIDELTRMVLANVICFKGSWKQEFETKNNQEDFFDFDDGIFVTYMTQEKQFMYGITDDADVLELSYSGDKLSMLFVLPWEQTADDLETKMTTEKITEMRSKLEKQMVNIWIPKFTIDFESSLDGNLMGMPSLFDVNEADLSGLSKENGLYVSKATHKTFLEIDEQGTKAAAFTGLFIQSRSSSTQFKLDKPFLFYILHKPSGAIIFSGKVMKPNKSM